MNVHFLMNSRAMISTEKPLGNAKVFLSLYIEGKDEDQMMEAMIAFCCQALGSLRRDKLGLVSIKRVKSAPRGIAHLEVVAVFEDTHARDYILMRGPMLSEYRDKDNNPTAGISLDIPAHLMVSFKILESFGFALRRRHGNNLKKHVKFDEFSETLFLQVGLKHSNPEEPTNWTEYSAEEARNGLKQLNAKKGPRFDFMSSPVASAKDTSVAPTRKGPSNANSGFPWVPPQRSKPAGGSKRREEDVQDMDQQQN